MITLDDAVALVVEAAGRDASASLEHLSIDHPDLPGRILARDLRLDRDHPPFDRATMDGIACRGADLEAGLRDGLREGVELAIAGELAAGSVPPPPPAPGVAIRIATGAAVPDGLDCVVERERLTDAGGGRVRVEPIDAPAGRNIHPRGVDGRAGDLVASAGTRIDPILVGLAASVGTSEVPVRRRPRVTVIATGDELRSPEDRLEAAGDAFRIRDGNRPMIATTLATLGAEVIATTRVPDDLDTTIRRFRSALAESDLVLTIGGVSAGDRDLVPAAAEAVGLAPRFRGVRIQPGRPTAAWSDPDGRLRLFGLPGNPVSCLVATHLLVRPWIAGRLGRRTTDDWSERTLDRDARPNPARTACRPAIADGGAVRIAEWHGSGDLPHLAGTTGIVRLPESAETVPSGTTLPYLPWRPGTAMVNPDGTS